MDEPTPVVLTPGPVALHPDVAARSRDPGFLHHRSRAFRALLLDIEVQARAALGLPDRFAMAFPGLSGSGMTEMMIRAVCGAMAVRPGATRRNVLLVTNGGFGDRLVAIAQRVARSPVHVMRCGEGGDVDLAQLDERLAQDAVGAVIMVHHETSVGQLNDAAAVFARCRAAGAWLALDMISSLGTDAVDLRVPPFDVAVSVSGKGLAAHPGVGVLMVDRAIEDAVRPVAPDAWSLDLIRILDAQRIGQTPFTAPVSLYPGLHAAFVALAQEGAAAKRARHLRHRRALRTALGELGYGEVAVDRPSSTTITFTYLPDAEPQFDAHLAELEEQGIHLLQNPLSQRARCHFQVSTMGWLTDAQVDRAVAAIRALPPPSEDDRMPRGAAS